MISNNFEHLISPRRQINAAVVKPALDNVLGQVSGLIIKIENAAVGEQVSLTPAGRNYTYTRKNLFDVSRTKFSYDENENLSIPGGYQYDLYTGANGQNHAIPLADIHKVPIYPAGTYTLSWTGATLRAWTVADDGTVSMKTDSSNPNTFTLTEPTRITLRKSVLAVSEIGNIQLEVGSEITSYEPFMGGYTTNVFNARSSSFVIISDEPGEITAVYQTTEEGEQVSYTNKDKLSSITWDRQGMSKFFGFGICQKVEVKLVDRDRTVLFFKNDPIRLEFDGNKVSPYFFIDEIGRNENTNELTLVGYDAIKSATQYSIGELNLTSYSIGDLIETIASQLGVAADFPREGPFLLSYESGANFNGSETLRAVLDYIAEATQTIYYINYQNKLVFKRLDRLGAASLVITRGLYFTMDTKEQITLKGVCNATELGDNIGHNVLSDGVIQYVRDNPLWDARTDIGDLVIDAAEAVGGTSIHEFNCSWRGNYFSEIGDKIVLTTKDNQFITSYILNDTITYTGGMKQQSQWTYTTQDEIASTPATIGEAIKHTSAKVNRVDNKITLVASQADTNASNISTLQLNTDSIGASVSSIQESYGKAIDEANSEISKLTSKVDATMTATDIQLAITTELEKGVDKVETSTGFTFNEDGLTVSKSSSDISTRITEDGMLISKGGQELLTATHEGVKAEDLHATTFLIIGTNSRLENYDTNRTGCFWIGG